MDAVYMEATTAMTGHGGWPMTVVLDHDGGPFFAGTYFPDRPRHGQPSFRQVLEAIHEAWTERGDEVVQMATQLREHLNRAAPSAAGAVDRELVEAAVTGWSATSTRRPAGSAGHRSSHRRWCWSSCCGSRRARRPGPADARRDARGDGPRRPLRPARRRLRALRRRPRLGGAALREDALRQRAADGALRAARRPGAAPGRDRDGRLRGGRARHRGGRLRLGAGRRQRG